MHHNVFQGPRSFVIHINIYAESLMDPMHSKTIRLVCVRPAGESRQSWEDREGPPAPCAESPWGRCRTLCTGLTRVYSRTTELLCSNKSYGICWSNPRTLELFYQGQSRFQWVVCPYLGYRICTCYLHGNSEEEAM